MIQHPLLNPYQHLRSRKLLAAGVAGIVVSTALSYAGGLHFHGMLHMGSAPNGAWWCFAAEHLIIWLVPAALLHLLQLIFCRHNVHPAKMLGAVAFAQLPFVPLSALSLLPIARKINSLQSFTELETLLSNTANSFQAILLLIVSLLFIVATLVWMFKVATTVCQLRSYRLWTVYLLSVFGAEALVRQIIPTMY